MVAAWIKNMVEDIVKPAYLEVGKVVDHPKGYKVKIISGQRWGEHGWSNWWTWRKVLTNGKLGKSQSGYGW